MRRLSAEVCVWLTITMFLLRRQQVALIRRNRLHPLLPST